MGIPIPASFRMVYTGEQLVDDVFRQMGGSVPRETVDSVLLAITDKIAANFFHEKGKPNHVQNSVVKAFMAAAVERKKVREGAH